MGHAPINIFLFATEMSYPSTTQALFALVVMIIVLLFILVYCCSGTFPCNQADDNGVSNLDPTGRRIQNQMASLSSRTRRSAFSENADLESGRRTVVIVPYNGMVYCHDRHSDTTIRIPTRDKPPAYSDIFTPPPPYSIRTVTPSPTHETCLRPPPYEDSFQDWKLTFTNDNNNLENLSKDSTFRNDPQTRTIKELLNESSLSQPARTDSTSLNQELNTSQPTRNISSLVSQATISANVEARTPTTSRVPGSARDHAREENVHQICSGSESNITSLSSVDCRSVPADSHSAEEVNSTARDVNSDTVQRRNSELVLRVPESDVYSLIRDVAVAEDSRKTGDGVGRPR